jgi:hypothetical protein
MKMNSIEFINNIIYREVAKYIIFNIYIKELSNRLYVKNIRNINKLNRYKY